MARPAATIESVQARAYRIPTDAPESDGTIAWDATTLVAVWVEGGGRRGFGYTYGDAAAARVAEGVLAEAVRGIDALDPPAANAAMGRAIRNVGRSGVAGMALSALDFAVWDLKGKLLGQPLAALLGRIRHAVPVYGSGGFCTYGPERVAEQLGGWVAAGMAAVKMKVGRDARADTARVRAAREAIGGAGLFVDANGAWTRKEALGSAARMADEGVSWLEEPVSSDDLAGLRFIRERVPAGMDVAAGEYGHDALYFRRMLEASAVDVLQADATRCGGVTGFLAAAAVAAAFQTPLSSHCAPSLHVSLLCAAPTAVHAEWFHDHVRIEGMLVDGAARASSGTVAPDLSRAGLGLELKREEAERWAVR